MWKMKDSCLNTRVYTAFFFCFAELVCICVLLALLLGLVIRALRGSVGLVLLFVTVLLLVLISTSYS